MTQRTASQPPPSVAPTAAPPTHIDALLLPIDPDLPERELVDRLRAIEDAKAHLCAVQADLAVQLDSTVRARHEQSRTPAAQRGRDVAGLIAFARRESPSRGSRLLGLAHALTEQPHAHDAMRMGVLSEWRATQISRETACLSREDRAVFDERFCSPTPEATDPDDTYRFAGWGDRRLVAEAQRLVTEIDPAALVNRRRRAEADRRVSMRAAPDTMSQLSALLPVAQGVAVWATLTRIADQARAAGDERSRNQVMADAMVERITGQTRADAAPITINLVVSDQTLLGDSQAPGWIQGYGPIPADAVDDLTREAASEGRAALRRLYARPDSGALVAMESVAREFPAGLARFLDLRDRACRTPYCDAPIRHHDHATDHALGGPTTSVNGQSLCVQCNHTKQAPGWRASPSTGPPGSRHVIETTLPTGHTMRSTAPAMPTPWQTQVFSHAEIVLTEFVMVA